MFFIYPTLHATCKKACLENAHHAHYKSCWKSIHHEVDYEITVETTVLEKIIVEMERNIVTISFLITISDLKLKQITIH